MWIALIALITPYRGQGRFILISYAQAPERPSYVQILANNDVLAWKVYLWERLVEEGFGYRDFRKLRNIAQCESGWRQYDENGNVLSGKVHPPDKGIFQVNTAVHEYDVSTPEANIDAAIEIYKQSGIKPWVCKP